MWAKQKRKRESQWRGSRHPNDTPWMRAQLADQQRETGVAPTPLADPDSIYQDQIRFGREQLKNEAGHDNR
jgi:hypothetical protein